VYRRKDSYYARAKEAGYRSRAAFKLAQVAQRFRLFRRGDCVLDLGAWPGGWLQVAAQHVGPGGKVVGVDLQPIGRLRSSQVVTLVGDITNSETQERVAEVCNGLVDVFLSDMAPKLSGIRSRDEAQAQALAESVLLLVTRLLRPGGKLVVKLFMSPDLQRYVSRLRVLFHEVRLIRPGATRKESAEVYAVGSGFRGCGTAGIGRDTP
jgi:23S rRNA (uridine2552-2'-O)-methyltransferase